MFPEHENLILFTTLLLLAEPHFGATWPFLLNIKNKEEIKNKRVIYIIFPIMLAIFSLVGFFTFYSVFILLFFTFNIFHVTRQSIGISKLFASNFEQINFQKYVIYGVNILFFIVGILRFNLTNLIQLDTFYITSFVIIVISISSIIFLIKFKDFGNLLTLITGCLIFLPICFMEKPIHALVMGVTMHYSQYLVLTLKVHEGRKKDPDIKMESKNSFSYFSNFILIISIYGLFMSILAFAPNYDATLKNLIVIPLIGQMIHFYLDTFLWRFQEQHHRDVTYKYI
tara:strand:- start:236 stop:1087 length:852 start_codon:yes stop_codon:yes gene_type:complete